VAVSLERPVPVIVRPSAALTSSYVLAGEVDVTYARCAHLLLSYAQGGAGGYASFYAQGVYENRRSARWYDVSILDATITKTVDGFVTALGRHVVNLQTGTWDRAYPMSASVLKKLRFYFAEVGNTDAPGTLEASVALELGSP